MNRRASLIEALRARAVDEASGPLYTLLREGEEEAESLTAGELDARARALAVRLREAGALPGERALLLFPPGLDFIAAFFGCLYAGVVAVPAYPPRRSRAGGRLDPGLLRMRAIARDARPRLVLTPGAALARTREAAAGIAELAPAVWVAADEPPRPGEAALWKEPPVRSGSLCFLQYTSGSTGQPKGVMVTHGNLLHNEELIRAAFGQSEASVVVGWLPMYHDMGLIGNVLQPLYAGARCVLMSPMSFLQKPRRWLAAISRYRATTSGGPDFAYDLCVRKVAGGELEGLDLGSWSVAFNGAEPVRSGTLDRFAEAFAPCGFRREAFFPCYGLAEATLFVAGGPRGAPRSETFAAGELLHGRAVPVPGGDGGRRLVSCGPPAAGQEVAIVDPESGARRTSGEVGEIWVAGPSVAAGYWERPEETVRDFAARPAGEPEAGPFLRTGDLGFFHEGFLFVAGRLKDLIIIRGRNHYPQDLELTAERSSPGLRPGCGAAFSVEGDGEERLVIVQEVEPGFAGALADLAEAVRRAVAEEHEVSVAELVLLAAGGVPKTTSGKVQRRACRDAYLAGGLPGVLGRSTPAPAPAAEGEAPAATLRMLREAAARALRIAPAQVDPARPLSALGLDSLGAVELAQEIEAVLGTAPPVARLLAGVSLLELAAELAAVEQEPEQESRRDLALAVVAGEPALSFGQRALWFLQRLAPESAAYNLSAALRARAGLDPAALRRALGGLLERHGALRATFPAVRGEPVVRLLPAAGLEIEEIQAGGWSEPRLLAELSAAAETPFDLERGPLLRVRLYHRESGPVLLLSVHHLVADFWSFAVLARELGALYGAAAQGEPAPDLPPPAMTYGDFVRRQRAWLAGPAGEEAWAYWRQRLEGELPPLALATDRPRPAVQTYRGAAVALRLDRGPTASLRELGAGHGATPFMVLLAAFQALLGRWTGQEDLRVGSPAAGRTSAAMAGLVGYLVNPVVLRAELAGDPTFSELLGRVRGGVLAALRHQEYPFPLLAERLQPERDPARSPLFQALLVLQSAQEPEALAALALRQSGAALRLGPLELEPMALPHRSAQLDLTLMAAELAGRLALSLQFNRDLFDAATARRLLGGIEALLAAAAGDPRTRLADLALLSAGERWQLLGEWNDTAREWPGDDGLAALLARRAAENPDAVAVVCAPVAVRYGELRRRVAALAERLERTGAGPEERVAVAMERSPGMVVAVLAAVEAGCAFVPLDPSLPAERLAFLLADARPRAVLVQRGTALPAGPWQRIEVPDETPDGSVRRRPALPLHDRAAYVIYTSGSTGRPKGVVVGHRALLNRLLWAQEQFQLGAGDAVLQSAGFGFDFAVWEILAPLLAGGRLVLAAPGRAHDAGYLAGLVAEQGVTIAHFVPAMLSVFLEARGVEACCASLRLLMVGGEALSRDLQDRCAARLAVELWNQYGPTEATIDATFSRCRPGTPVSIGRAIANSRTLVLDAAQRLLPMGAAGELCLGGAPLARGYLDRPDLTAEKFVPDPWPDRPGERLYRTGDLVRRLPDGGLEYLGRLDQQVKLRGFRIELGEIEAALRDLPGVREAVALLRQDVPGGAMLVAYLVADGGARLEPAGLRRLLRRRLPDFMVPPVLLELPEIPLTRNGKLDRRALPAPERSHSPEGSGDAAPRTPLEELLAEVWAEVLGAGRVGIHDDFFALGGHSLLAVRAAARIEEALETEVPLALIFQAPTVAGLAERLAGARRGRAAPPLVRRSPGDAVAPLSFAQERLWFLDQMEPGNPVYNVPGAVRMSGPLDPGALRRALAGIVRRHEALRTRFGVEDGAPVQAVDPPAELPVPGCDLSSLPAAQAADELARLGRELGRRPFDLARGPLVRAALLRLAAAEHVLLLIQHHIVADGWSLEVLLRELAALYAAEARGGPSPLRELPLQYADFAVWQRRWLAGEVLEEQLAYWRHRLAGIPAAAELPFDRPRPPRRSYRGGHRSLALPAGPDGGLRALGRSQGATLFMVLAAAVHALLGRYSSGEISVLGTPVAGRGRGELAGLIGLFVNTLALRADLAGAPSVRELLRRVRRAALEAYAHQDLPFEKLVEELAPARDPGRTPLFQVALALRPALPRLDDGGLAFTTAALETGTAKFDLTFFVVERADGLELTLEYDADRFDGATALRVLGHLSSLLAVMAQDVDRGIGDLPLLAAGERQQILREWGSGTVGAPLDGAPIHQLVLRRAEAQPEALAVAAGGSRLTYGELARRASALAARLRGTGAGPESLVGLYLDRSPELVVGALAVLLAGGAYVPLDPAHPEERLAAIADETGMRTLLTRRALGDGGLAARFASGRVLCLDEEAPEGDAGAPPPAVEPDGLAYVIYTSGSTGRPKGVQITHRGLSNLVLWHLQAYGVTPADRATQVAAPGFDASVWEVWPYLAAGASLHIPDEETRLAPGRLLRWLADERITLSFLPTPLAEAVLAEPVLTEPWAASLTLRALLTGGDRLRRSPAEPLPFQFRNHYGPTESSVVATWGSVPAGPRQAPPPLGRPVDGTRVHLLDPWMTPVPAGLPGEVFLGGAGLARGYLGRPELTAERFVPDRFGGEPGARLYRTGDLARWLPDGALEFLGRLDHQVKIRGVRVEPGEVEAALARLPAVRQAVVLARQGRGEPRLIAWVVPADPELPPAPAELRDLLAARLPEAMVPASFVLLPELPLTASGKVDRAALPDSGPAAEGGAPPRGPVEELLAALWSDLLGVPAGADGDFFALGGHSLLATRAMARVREAFGVDLPLRDLFEHPTPAGLARRIGEARGVRPPAPPPLVRVPREPGLPLSFAQERLWFLEQLEPQAAAYNLASAYELRGRLEERERAALAAALAGIVRRHEALRTTFPAAAGVPSLAIAPPEPGRPLPQVDLAALPRERREVALRALLRAEERRPFDLVRGPLLRCLLIRLEPARHALLLAVHHIVADGWSVGLFARELAALYAAALADRPPLLPDPPVQYADFAVWQRRWLQGEVLAAEVEHWRRRLAGAPAVLELPADRPRPAVPSRCGGHRRTALPPPLAADLRRLAGARGATLFMVLLAGWQALLHRVTGQDDLSVGTPVANRGRTEIEGTIGLFVNTLVLRAELAADPTFQELLRAVREGALDAFAHADLPFEKLVERLQPQRALAASPLFQVLFALQNAPGAPLALPGLEVERLAVAPGAAKLDLTLILEEREGGIAGAAGYRLDLFDPATVARLLGRYRALLAAAVREPGRRLSELPLLGEAEAHQLLVEWGEGGALPPPRTLWELFAQRAAAAPGDVVLIAGAERLTGGELFWRAAALACTLRGLGVGPEVRVAVCLERSADLVVALLAALGAGGAYVPLDPAYPRDRLSFLLEDSGAAVLLTREALLGRLPERRPQTLCLAPGGAPPAAAAPPPGGAGPENLAYLIYTSGSTGRPKGVAIEHRSAAALLAWACEVFRPDELSGVFASTSICFDLSVFELFLPLAAGGTVILGDDALALPGLPAAGRVTLINTVPSAMAELLRLGALPPSVRTVNLAGEPLRRALVEALHATGTVERVYNLYGPSEDTTYSTFARALPGAADEPTIGRPVAGTGAHVLDRRLRPLPAGSPGELHLAGAGLARGYHGRPDLTAERFLPDPFGGPGGRLYRTGDLARRRAGGEIEFLGRLDHQVKVRGYRIEPGEIETLLLARPDLRAAAVVARSEGGGGPRLVAYVVAADGARPWDRELRAWLLERLPEHMVPSAFVPLEALPLTPNGKLDRRALPAPDWSAGAGPSAPATASEELLAAIWCEVLGLGRCGAEDDFFALGGHSLLATRAGSRIREAFGIELPLRALFERPTVRGLARHLDEALRAGGGEAPAPPVTPVPRDRDLALSYAQERLWFLDRLEPAGSAYNIPSALALRGPLSIGVLAGALAEEVRRHEALRTTFHGRGGTAVQVVAPAAAPPLPLIDLSALPGRHAVREADRLQAEEARRPFDLARGPLLRARLARLAPDEHRLFLTLHHIVADGWSLGVLIAELSALYAAALAGRPSPLPDLPLHYADFAAWQRAWLRDEALAVRLAWWRERLTGAPPALELPADRPRPAAPGVPPAGREPLACAPELGGALERLARRRGATLFMVLLAGFDALLHRYTAVRDLVVGTAVASRGRVELEGLIGFFVNTLALRVEVAPEAAFADLLGRVREVALAAYVHQDLPFDKLVAELQPERHLARTPLVQVMLTFQAAPPAPRLPGLEAAVLPVENGAAKLDLALNLAAAADGGIDGAMIYRADLFAAATARRLARHLVNLLAAACGDPSRPVADLPLLSPAELAQLVVGWNDTAAGPLPARAFHHLFEEQARRVPAALAVRCGEESLSYRELDERAGRLARRLLALGAGPERRVAVLLERSIEAVVAVLAAFKAGAAYVPLDPAFPRERLASMLADSGARVAVTRSELRALLPPGAPALLLLDADAPWEEPLPGGFRGEPEHLAYVIYTSGSTGRPKGVGVEHGHLLAYVGGVLERLRLAPGASYATVSTLAADLGNTAIFPALATGGALHIIPGDAVGDPERFADHAERWPVDCLKIVPSHLAALLASPRAASVLPRRLLVLGGESAGSDLIGRVRRLAPECRILIHYGPTETTVGVLTHELEGAPAGPPPIGRPLPGVRAHVVDAGLRLLPIGVAGELCVGGESVSRGYLGRPEATAGSFVPDPFGPAAGGRLYRTGDRVRRRADGGVEFLGRLDQQVKIRGFRVEPGEVEAALRRQPGVAECAVVARPAPGAAAGEPPLRLVAYLVPAVPGGLSTAAERAALRAALRGELPEHAVPAHLVPLAALPVTANGKLDRAALPEPEGAAAEPAAGGEARTPVEEILAGIWGEVLGAGRVGPHDGFFDLGGHSLLAIQAVSRIRAALGIELPLRDLFEEPTPAGLAARLDRAGRQALGFAAPPVERVPRGGELPLSFAQQRLWLVDRLAGGSAFYNMPAAVELRGGLDVPALAWTFWEVRRRHEALRTNFAARGGQPVQIVRPPGEETLPVVDLRALPAPARRDEARRLAAAEAAHRFDLEREPLLRTVLVRSGEREHRLLMTMHHIVSDGWSIGLLVREVTAIYGAASRGLPSPLREPAVQYPDFAVWQRRWLQGEVLAAHLDWWRRHLGSDPPSPELPVDRQPPPVRSYRGGRRTFPFPAALGSELAALARSEGVTLFMLLLTGFEALLHRLSGQRDFVVGAAVAGRDRVETEGLIGCFVNLLALRVAWQGNPRFRELLARVREVSLQAFAHQDLPFDRLVAELRPERQGGGRPLVAVAFGVQSAPRALPDLPGLELEMGESGDGVARFDLTLWVNERPGGLSASWTYSSDLFEAATVERLHERFVSLLAGAVADPAARLDALEVRTAAERGQGTERERRWRELKGDRLTGIRRSARGTAVETEEVEN